MRPDLLRACNTTAVTPSSMVRDGHHALALVATEAGAQAEAATVCVSSAKLCLVDAVEATEEVAGAGPMAEGVQAAVARVAAAKEAAKALPLACKRM